MCNIAGYVGDKNAAPILLTEGEADINELHKGKVKEVHGTWEIGGQIAPKIRFASV